MNHSERYEGIDRDCSSPQEKRTANAADWAQVGVALELCTDDELRFRRGDSGCIAGSGSEDSSSGHGHFNYGTRNNGSSLNSTDELSHSLLSNENSQVGSLSVVLKALDEMCIRIAHNVTIENQSICESLNREFGQDALLFLASVIPNVLLFLSRDSASFPFNHQIYNDVNFISVCFTLQ